MGQLIERRSSSFACVLFLWFLPSRYHRVASKEIAILKVKGEHAPCEVIVRRDSSWRAFIVLCVLRIHIGVNLAMNVAFATVTDIASQEASYPRPSSPSSRCLRANEAPLLDAVTVTAWRSQASNAPSTKLKPDFPHGWAGKDKSGKLSKSFL